MTESLEYLIRSAVKSDEPFLWEMLYQAIFIPPGGASLSREILNTPELGRYVAGWGKPDDFGFLATQSRRPIGAVWLRLLTKDNRGYGHIDDDTPELSIAVAPEHRSRGVGSRLLTHLLREAQNRYNTISLSVSAENPAVRLYERSGFVMVRKENGAITMIRRVVAGRLCEDSTVPRTIE